MRLSLQRPWLIADLDETRRVASWALNRPGFVDARRIVWREVRNADLPQDLDAGAWLAAELAAAGLQDGVCLVTSRDITTYETASAVVDGERVDAVATVGLGNAQRVGTRTSTLFAPGTINVAVTTRSSLSDGALLEAMSVVTEARTLAMLEADLEVSNGAATGTGTDCVAVAARPAGAVHAGKHTAIGEAIGRATLEVVRAGVARWLVTQKGS